MAFPAQVGLAIETATEAIDRIIIQLQQEVEVQETLKVKALQRPQALPFGNCSADGYVSLQRTESRIYSALEKVDPVVLLYGGSGKGKSTVARQNLISKSLEKEKSTFKQVIFLECGLGADVEATQAKLLQSLGGGDDKLAVSGSQSNEEFRSGSTSTSQLLLRAKLKKQKVLIVLDDVWDPDFLHSFLLLGGAEVKYLVTSQEGNLCKRLGYKYVPVQIEDVKFADASKILAVHVGFQIQDIPDQFKETAKKVLNQIDSNPLVIAQVEA